VPYYVKNDFEANYGKRLRQVEQHVEDDYLTMLRTNCYREKNHRESPSLNLPTLIKLMTTHR